MRQTVTTSLYLVLVDLIAMYLVVSPVYAFQVSSSATGYVRVASSAAIGAYEAANRAAFTSAVASAVVGPTAASVAVRLVTGPVGWGLLGVSAALTLASMYYSQSDVAAVKAAALAAAPPVSQRGDGSGTTLPASAVWNPASCTHPCAIGGQQYFYTQFSDPNSTCYTGNGGGQYTLSGWPGWVISNQLISGPTCRINYQHTNNGSTASTNQEMGFVQPSTLTLGDYQTYVNGLPAANPLSVESKTAPVGQGVTAPAADQVTSLPVTPAQVVPTVKPASQVGPTDAVIDPNAPPPSGPQPVIQSTQTTNTNTTTTTTTNPDGSTTKQEADTASVSCSAGNHDQRTFGSVLQDHMNVWQGSGLLSALNLLKTLTWPSTIPTYSLNSTLLGTFTLDFSAWAGMFTAIRSIIIALAGFVAYRIVFVGGR